MFTAPWTLLVLFSVPVVVGIYLFRTRTKPREVSSLFLWSDQSQSQQGGRRLERIQLPLLLLLELLALALLSVAAAGPHWKMHHYGRPTVVILDDSYSMLAEIPQADGSTRSARDKAEETLHRFFEQEAGYPIQFVLADANGSLLSSRANTANEARAVLKEWKCSSSTAAIDAAISLATRTALSGAKILVVTDHAPKEEIAEGKLRWFSFGKAQPNLAIVHANRVHNAGKDRLLVEVANLSDRETPLRMSLFDSRNNRVLQRIDQSIDAEEVLSFRLSVGDAPAPDSSESTATEQGFPVEIRLEDDALKIDNRYTLLPVARRPVRVLIEGVPSEVRLPLEKAVRTSGIAELVRERPDLIFCGRSLPEVAGEELQESATPSAETTENVQYFRQSWIVRVYSESADSAQAYVGPFTVDRSNPLTTGLSLDGVVWAGSESAPMGGLPIISAGNTPFLTEQIHRNGTREVRMQITERLSTLTISPAWPVLIWNILKIRSDQLYGIPENNIRLGSEAVFIAAPNDHEIIVTDPSGEKRTYTMRAGRTSIPALQCGIYEAKAPSGTYSFSVGTLSREESNLKHGDTGTYGGWLDEQTVQADYKKVAWMLLLAAFAILILHLFLTSRSYAVSRA